MITPELAVRIRTGGKRLPLRSDSVYSNSRLREIAEREQEILSELHDLDVEILRMAEREDSLKAKKDDKPLGDGLIGDVLDSL